MTRRRARDDLRRDLAALAATPVTELAPERIETTEARLRAVHSTIDEHTPRHREPQGARRRALIGSGAVAAVALAALLTLFLVVDRGPSDHTSLLLTAAQHAFIELPDGRRIEAEVGRIEVPDGSRLVVETGGILTVDGITLEPGEVATVADGAIDIDRRATPGSGTPGADGSGPGDQGGGATGGSVGPGATGNSGQGGGGGGDATTTTRRAGDTTTTAASTATTRPADNSVAPTTTTDAPTTTTTPHDVAPLRAGAEIVDGEVVIRWARYDGADFRGYLVIATTNGTTPRPGGDGVTVLVARRDRDLTRTAVPYETGMKIRVLVFGPERIVLAASRVVEPGV